MTKFKALDRDHISFLTSVSGLCLSIAGVIANVVGNQTNLLFWIAVIGGVVVVLVGIAMRFHEPFFRTVLRPFFGTNIITIHSCQDHQVELVHSLASNHFGEAVTSTDQIRSIIRRYPDGLQVAIVNNDSSKPFIGGYYFYFPIQKPSVDRIIEFKFDVSSLDPNEIADRPDRGYAMYIGAIAGNSMQVRAELMGALKMNIGMAQKTKSATVYARAATTRGKQVLIDYGFSPVHPHAYAVGCFFQRVFSKAKAEPTIALGVFDPGLTTPEGKKDRYGSRSKINARKPRPRSETHIN
jgi:hypothetical protein